ncbi:BON domain-containing protein [Cryptosporangium japonicum]|uniref:BON domain-containing protein n=1 Tax=Cryptosporangium japonicum TaxID=80872 RepID=A0ABN0TFN9_9ACTN
MSIDVVAGPDRKLLVEVVAVYLEGSFEERPARTREPDERLTAAVAARLLLDDRTRTAPITPRADHGVVILTGSVRAAQVRCLAAEIAATTDGARDVCNAIRVARRRPPTARVYKAVLLLASYSSLIGGIVGSRVALIYVALVCGIGLSVLDAYSLRRQDAERFRWQGGG